MNRYHRGPTVGGPSKASANTLCQKCLKKGHYSYECKAVAQERPYVSRPSRTQQLLNPKLVPKLTSDVPQDLLRKKGVADEQLAKIELERGRKRERQSEEPENIVNPKRMRSASASSVSTISTNLSRSPSPQQAKNRRPQSPSLSHSPPRRGSTFKDRRSVADSISPTGADWEKKRRRKSSSSAHSYTSNDGENERQSRERGSSRSTRRRYQQTSPPTRGRRTEGRSPQRGRRRLSNDHSSNQENYRTRNSAQLSRRDAGNRPPHPPKERSLSPFSKRLALTQAMNMGR